jgi:hypothetical protein
MDHIPEIFEATLYKYFTLHLSIYMSGSLHGASFTTGTKFHKLNPKLD